MARARLLGIASVVFAALIAPTQLLAQDPAAPVPTPAQTTTGPDAGTAPAGEPPAGSAPAGGDSAPAAAAPDAAATESDRAVATAAVTKSVSVGDNFYSPKTISITVGDTVKWTNDGAAAHSATAEDGSFDTGVFNSGQSRTQKFDSPGTIAYYCTVHGKAQSGTIKVAAASTGGSGGDKSGSGSKGSNDSSAAATGQSEAAATSAPDAAGNDKKLPATGSAPLALAVAGLLLLAAGALAMRAQHPRRPRLRDF